MYKQDLTLDNQQKLICRKNTTNQPANLPTTCFKLFADTTKVGFELSIFTLKLTHAQAQARTHAPRNCRS